MKLAKPSVRLMVFIFLWLECLFAITGHCSKMNNLKGKQLRVVTGHFPPVISILRNSSGHIVGYSDQLYNHLLYLSQSLKFTFDIFPSKENTNGVKKNGTWNGIIGTLLRDEADLGLVPVAITLERYEAIEFCGRIGGDSTGILVRYPDPSVSFTSAVEVFSSVIWIGWIISGVVIVAISILIAYVSKRNGVDEQNAIRARTVAWYLFSTLVSQGNYFPSRQLSQRILAATWCLIAFVFVNIYNSTLTSYMSVTYQRPTINSFDDLATNPSYKSTILTGSIQEIDILRSPNENLKKVAERIQKCSDCKKFYLNDMFNAVLEKENYVSIMPSTIGLVALKKYNSERIKCRLAMAYENFSWKPMFLAVPKSSPYIEEINLGSLRFFDSGLRDYWYAIHEKVPKQCQLKYNSKGVASKRSSNRIKLEQFYLPFVILFVGYFLAFVQFCREHIRRLSLSRRVKIEETFSSGNI
uniref:Ionotropic glutamate receptor C-terminal domain-containing protein n=1 Tax=Daphnia galeata TaxID=27404 RepID=A0A8J2RD89_9CRUS|nr:unnamed protein product [Daphnia galeata]